jgi:biopolymer transport protein ExbD
VAFQFPCPQCRKSLAADEQHVGAIIKCTHCGQMIEIPQPFRAEEEDEAVKVQVGRGGGEDVDMTPMIDCVFLLLIFFLVTASFTLQKSKEVPPPEEKEATQARTIEEIEADDDYVIVRIDKDSTIWVNDSEAPSEADMYIKLRGARQPSRDRDAAIPTTLLVLAHEDAKYEVVVQVLDAGTAVGMEHVRLALDEEDLF